MNAPLRPHRRQGGFTLVELMISMALGLLIILALVTMLINVNKNNTELGSSNRLIENGRFAAQILAGDLQHAGFWAGYVPTYDDFSTTGAPADSPTAVPEPCTGFAGWDAAYQVNFLGVHVQGSNVPVAGTAPFCSGILSTPRPSNDVFVVRHAETCVAGSGLNECSAVNSTDVHIQVSRCGSDTSTFAIGTGTSTFTLYTRECEASTPTFVLAPIHRIASTIYYVKDRTETDGTVRPTLMRSVMASGTHTAAQELVENVEAFRIEYGIDSLSDSGAAVTQTVAINWADPANKKDPTNRGDGVPDAYVRCTQAAPCSAFQMSNAVTAKLYVLIRAERKSPGYTDDKVYKLGSADALCATVGAADTDATCAPKAGPFNDGYKRHLFTQTVRLVNVSGRRETP